MLGLLKRMLGPLNLTIGALGLIVLLGCMLKFSLESVYLPFIERAISTMIWILEFHNFD
jgi:hypothetical protein